MAEEIAAGLKLAAGGYCLPGKAVSPGGRQNYQRKFHNAKKIPVLQEASIPIIVLRFETAEGEDSS